MASYSWPPTTCLPSYSNDVKKVYRLTTKTKNNFKIYYLNILCNCNPTFGSVKSPSYFFIFRRAVFKQATR